MEESSDGEIDKIEMQLCIILLEKDNISFEYREHKEEAYLISVLKELTLKLIKFDKDKINLSPQVNLY